MGCCWLFPECTIKTGFYVFVMASSCSGSWWPALIVSMLHHVLKMEATCKLPEQIPFSFLCREPGQEQEEALVRG